jgi:hypothetical protein
MKGRIDARVIVSYVLSFVLSLVILCGAALVAVEIGFFNQNIFISLVGRDYYGAVHEELVKSIRAYTIPTGIDVAVVEDVFSIEDVMSDLNGCMYSMFEGSEYTPDLTRMDDKLKSNMKASFEGLELENQDAVMDAFVEDVNSIYVAGIKMPVLKYIVSAKTVYNRYLAPALILLLGVASVISTVLVMLYHRRYKGLRYVAYSFLAAAVMCFCVPFAILVSGVYKNLLFTPTHFYNLMISYIRNGIVAFIGVAAFLAVFAVLLALFIGSMAKRRAR